MSIVWDVQCAFVSEDVKELVTCVLGHLCPSHPDQQPLLVRVRTSRSYKKYPDGVHGWAYLGKSSTDIGSQMYLAFPIRKRWTEDTWRCIVAVTLHEVMHLIGIEHGDMTRDQKHCLGPIPDWCQHLPPLRDK